MESTNDLYMKLLAKAEQLVVEICNRPIAKLVLIERSSDRSRELDAICVRANGTVSK